MGLSENPELLLACAAHWPRSSRCSSTTTHQWEGATTGYAMTRNGIGFDCSIAIAWHSNTAGRPASSFHCRTPCNADTAVFSFSPATFGCELLLKTAACRPGTCRASRSPQAKLAHDVNAHSGVRRCLTD
jgi:hypothetical protein